MLKLFKNRLKFNAESVLIIIFTLLALGLLHTQLIYELLITPKETIYLGTIHYAPDYFSYLSQLIQGRDNWLYSQPMYMGEKLTPIFSRWPFVLLGHIAFILGINMVLAYHLAVLIFRITFFTAAYILIRIIFPKSAKLRLLSYFMFLFTTSWPLIVIKNGVLSITAYQDWYNLGNFYSRFGPTYHHLLDNTLMIAGLILTILWFRKLKDASHKGKLLFILGFILIGFVLVSQTPTHWLLLIGCTFIFAIVNLRIISRRLHFFEFRNFVPVLLIFLSGLPMLLDLNSVYSKPPYSTTSMWEGTQQILFTPANIFFRNGLIIVLALLGIGKFMRRLTEVRKLSLIFLVLSSLLTYSGILKKVGMSNMRFWPQAIYVILAVLAACGIDQTAEILGKKKLKESFVIAFVLLIFTVTTALSLFGELRQMLKPRIGDSRIYLPSEISKLYNFILFNTDKDGVFLVPWPYNDILPALANRRVFYGDGISLLCLNAPEKNKLAERFYSESMSDSEVENFLKEKKLKYVIGYPGSKVESYSFLKPVYQTSKLVLYEEK